MSERYGSTHRGELSECPPSAVESPEYPQSSALWHPTPTSSKICAQAIFVLLAEELCYGPQFVGRKQAFLHGCLIAHYPLCQVSRNKTKQKATEMQKPTIEKKEVGQAFLPSLGNQRSPGSGC